MNSAYPGSFLVSGRAYVENPRPVPGKPRTVVLDVYFMGPREREHNEIPCSLRFFRFDDALVIADSLYDLVATVTSFHSLRLPIFILATGIDLQGGRIPPRCQRTELKTLR